MSDSSRAVEVDAAMERQGLTWAPVKWTKVIVRLPHADYRSTASGDAAVFAGRLHFGVFWEGGRHIVMHDAANVSPVD